LLPAAFDVVAVVVVVVVVVVVAAFVGAAEGCDLLTLILKSRIKRSQPSAAPTREGL